MTDRSAVTGNVGASRVIGGLDGDGEKVRIIGDDDSPLPQTELNMSRILRAQQFRITGRRRIHASITEPTRDGMVHVFVQMKAEHNLIPRILVWRREGLRQAAIAWPQPSLRPRESR